MSATKQTQSTNKENKMKVGTKVTYTAKEEIPFIAPSDNPVFVKVEGYIYGIQTSKAQSNEIEVYWGQVQDPNMLQKEVLLVKVDGVWYNCHDENKNGVYPVLYPTEYIWHPFKNVMVKKSDCDWLNEEPALNIMDLW